MKNAVSCVQKLFELPGIRVHKRKQSQLSPAARAFERTHPRAFEQSHPQAGNTHDHMHAPSTRASSRHGHDATVTFPKLFSNTTHSQNAGGHLHGDGMSTLDGHETEYSDEDEMHCDEGFVSEPPSPGASQHATRMEAMIAQVDTNDVSIRSPRNFFLFII